MPFSIKPFTLSLLTLFLLAKTLGRFKCLSQKIWDKSGIYTDVILRSLWLERSIRTFILRLGSDSRGEGIQSHMRWNASPTFIEGFIMSWGNRFNHLLKNIKESFPNNQI